MAKQGEAALVRAIIRAVTGEYPKAIVVKLADRFTRGLPDLLIVTLSTVYFVECKSEIGKLTPLQQAFQRRVDAVGGRVLHAVARSVHDVMSMLMDHEQ